MQIHGESEELKKGNRSSSFRHNVFSIIKWPSPHGEGLFLLFYYALIHLLNNRERERSLLKLAITS